MIIVKGKAYCTTADIAENLGVSAKTIREYLHKGIIPPPPVIKYGVRTMNYFPPEYIESAKIHLENYRNRVNVKKSVL